MSSIVLWVSWLLIATAFGISFAGVILNRLWDPNSEPVAARLARGKDTCMIREDYVKLLDEEKRHRK